MLARRRREIFFGIYPPPHGADLGGIFLDFLGGKWAALSNSTAAVGGGKFWGSIKDRYWVPVSWGGVGGGGSSLTPEISYRHQDQTGDKPYGILDGS